MKRQSVLAPLLAIVLGVATLIALGIWQLERLAWKENLLATINSRLAEEAVPLAPRTEWATLSRDVDEYRRVTVSGTFDHTKESFVFFVLDEPHGKESGPGFLVMTPLRLDSGGTILVNRGFVPQSRKDTASRAEGNPVGSLTLTGLLRWSEARNWFSATDAPDKRIWYTRDIASIAAADGLADAAPFSIDAEASGPGGLPQGGETRVHLSNRHFGYALTWFGLAGALILVGGVFVHRRLTDKDSGIAQSAT